MKYRLLGVVRDGKIEGILTETVEGVPYLIEIHVDKEIRDKEKIAKYVKEKIEERFPTIVVKRVPIKKNIIYVEIVETSTPITWAVILAYLPEILAAIGFVVTLIAVYLAMSEVPGWIIGLLIVGMLLMAPEVGLLWLAFQKKKK